MKTFTILLLTLLISCKAPMRDTNLPLNESIRLNQIGFYPQQHKIAILVGEAGGRTFSIFDKNKKEVVYTGVTKDSSHKSLSGNVTSVADFSSFSEAGEFVLIIDQVGKSHPFSIRNQVNSDLANASLKAFYFQRASTEIKSTYAGKWARPLAHPDKVVMIHPSASSVNDKEGEFISASFGWYDAGDYNKYIVNSGITVGTLLSLYEDFPTFFQDRKLDIPESENATPDILDEIRWNLDWMIAMQDSNDGGVYHKLTSANFEGIIAPEEAKSQRYVVAKSTAATLDFAAVMAQASRVYKAIYPEKAIIYLKAAEKAWAWSIQNPEIVYDQNALNKQYTPAITTGAYGDAKLDDEWVWAAAELYVTTHNLVYWECLKSADQRFVLPSWNSVSWLGFYSLLRHQSQISNLPQDWISMLKINLLEAARNIVKEESENAFHTAMGTNPRDFVWGSNSVAANQGIMLLYAYMYSDEKSFVTAAQDNLDYLLGRNATGYSYVTGFGSQTPLHPHHRLAMSRPDLPPLPGFLVGGPNPGQQDGCDYPSKFADESYTDDDCSYASNEIAINWNASFAYLVNALEAVNQ